MKRAGVKFPLSVVDMCGYQKTGAELRTKNLRSPQALNDVFILKTRFSHSRFHCN